MHKYKSEFPEYDAVAQEVFEKGYITPLTDDTNTGLGKIGRYELIHRLGAGGQAEVFLARHGLLRHKVVVKIARHVCHNREEENSLINEGRILARLEHPILAQIQDLGFHEGRPFLVMRYENGHCLTQGVDNARYDFAEAVRIILGVADAVALAHKNGVVHLDIKPGNVLLREDNSPCLIDFGLAQLAKAVAPNTQNGRSVVGTAAFMSPEQAAGDWSRIGPRSDVFGLGALLYWFLTGLAPFHGSTLTRCMDCARSGNVDHRCLDWWDFPPELTTIALRAMAHNPDDRFESIEAFAEELRKFLRSNHRRKQLGRAFTPLTNAAKTVDYYVQAVGEQISSAEGEFHVVRGCALTLIAVPFLIMALLWLLLPFLL